MFNDSDTQERQPCVGCGLPVVVGLLVTCDLCDLPQLFCQGCYWDHIEEAHGQACCSD
ncbi:MAG: hypothetical protein HQL54_07075 [Magnetococcales bacterium]|nr:hypothetical protein [Magnetococcales bacterium]